MKKTLAILIILLIILTIWLALPGLVSANGEPTSPFRECKLAATCTGEECNNRSFYAPPGTEFCQVDLSAGEGYFEFSQSGQTPCGLVVSGLGKQSTSITRASCPTVIFQAWFFAGPPAHRAFLPFVWSGWVLPVDGPPLVFDTEN